MGREMKAIRYFIFSNLHVCFDSGFLSYGYCSFFLCLLDFGDSVLKNGTGDGFEY